MKSLYEILFVLALAFATFAGVSEAYEEKAAEGLNCPANASAGVASVDPASKDWVKKQLIKGKPVLLTNSYIFQVAKGLSQENQIAAEESLLIPILNNCLAGMIRASNDSHTKRLFSVALALLADKPALKLPEEAVKQAEQIKGNSMFKPRGHYTDSESLKRYFIAMQYLAKATIDVSIDKASFPFPQEMLFPFETAQAARRLFRDPANEHLVRQWNAVHSFYSGVNGPADMPTFSDLARMGAAGKLNRDDVKNWAKAKNMPRINPERGLGIQPLGERFSLHQGVIDEVKREFLKDDTPKERISEVLDFKNLAGGYKTSGHPIQGFYDRIASDKGNSYYARTMKAISLGALGWQTDPMKLNFFASAITGLAEQTALMTKTAILVSKSANSHDKMPSGLKLYFEPGSAGYILALSQASRSMRTVCERLRKLAPADSGRTFKMHDPTEALRAFARLAKVNKPLVVDGRLWQSCGPIVSELARKPAVTVDVFQVKDRSGAVSYYQWAIAPFKASYPTQGDQPQLGGLTMVFFDGWSDEIVPGAQGPLTNLEWENRVIEGNLRQLHSLIPMPEETEAK